MSNRIGQGTNRGVSGMFNQSRPTPSAMAALLVDRSDAAEAN
jgi:hypothetical protein